MSEAIQTARSLGLESQVRDAVAKVFSSVGAETVDLDVAGLAGANVTISPNCELFAFGRPEYFEQ